MRRFSRLATRVSVLAALLTVGSVVAVQYEAIAVRYMTLRHEVDDTSAQVAALKTKLAKQKNDVRRLQDPRGAVPEIHERLKQFRPNEEVIYLRGVPSPAPGAWEGNR